MEPTRGERFEGMFRANYPLVRAYALRRAAPDAAQDAVADTFLVAWRRLEEFGLVIREWQVDRDTGALRYEMLDQLLSPRTRLVAFTHCSNVASIVHDVPALAKKIHATGALVFDVRPEPAGLRAA